MCEHVQKLPVPARHNEGLLLLLSHLHDRFIFFCMVAVTLAHVLSLLVSLASLFESDLMQGGKSSLLMLLGSLALFSC